ncbi:phage N-6-adenine-methyltransferase [Phytobacter diazotrophicus]|uniref:phage N-6-adenine-methyltransferase n=1 Tax=Phytobacter diazotrophicus TaxID=395631 RepID=UPI00232FF10E|nr:phage N-6-adenine-methyltransferase [Phytobacter diazotrophicus]MDC0726585.1 phage N-6-adenine-methyltransferase [Phytobacter diazotrophicus]MDC0733860.1 phage N-6-adenine-methyltransferase [Phytobacter diazotrophicus]
MTNKYTQALNELRGKASHELKEIGDQWCTPDNIFWGINAMFGPLVLDLFTDGENSKCPDFYTAEDNALTHDWSERLAELNGAAFANPPYSRAMQHDDVYITGMRHIVDHTMAMREKGGRYVILIKAATSEVWWPENADHIAFIRGRIGFDVPKWFIPKDEKQVPSGAFFAGAVAVFDKNWNGPATSYISRKDLEARGDAFMAQIHREALRMLPQIQQQNIPEIIPKPIVKEAVAENVPLPVARVESELPLTQEDILSRSGVETWACVRAAFGNKDEYSFNESKFAHTWAADTVSKPTVVTVTADTILVAESLIEAKSLEIAVSDWLNKLSLADSSVRDDLQERLVRAGIEAVMEHRMTTPVFISALESLPETSRENIRLIRAHIRQYAATLTQAGEVHS